MNCRRVEKLIPLYVERDLESRIAGQVASHLDWCGRCNWLADEYRESQGWLHSSPPPEFDEAVLGEIKATVLKRAQEINTRSSVFASLVHPWNRRNVLALSTASLIALGVLVFYIYQTTVPITPEVRQTATQQPENEKSNESPVPTETAEAPGFEYHLQPATLNRSGHRSKKRVRIASPERAPIVASATAPLLVTQSDNVPDSNPSSLQQAKMPASGLDSREMLRIEIQTSDPRIRIIWFAPKETDWHQNKPATD